MFIQWKPGNNTFVLTWRLHTSFIPHSILKNSGALSLLVLLIVSGGPGNHAQALSTVGTVVDTGVVVRERLFDSHDVLEVHIYTLLDSLLSDVEGEGSLHSGQLVYTDRNGHEVGFPVGLETRGNFRRRPENCNFPPLMLRFGPENVNGTLFEDQDRLKLVTHCRTGQEEFCQILLQEYMIYRWYEALTPLSYKVRLLRITYHDIGKPGSSVENFGFLIERTRDMARRNRTESVDFLNLHPNRLDPEAFTLLALFQHLILNNDWAVELQHNIKLVSKEGGGSIYPVPYDFDWAGLIAAPYRNVSLTEELEDEVPYRGVCIPSSILKRNASVFIEKKDFLFDLVELSDCMTPASKERYYTRLNAFYRIIESRRNLHRVFHRKCLK